MYKNSREGQTRCFNTTWFRQKWYILGAVAFILGVLGQAFFTSYAPVPTIIAVVSRIYIFGIALSVFSNKNEFSNNSEGCCK
jgi:lipopolysaccharide export LptBFGC system permease protein LptF